MARTCLALLLLATATLAQPPQPTLTFKGHTDPIYTVSLSPDGQVLATGSFDKTIRLWNASSGAELRQLSGKGGHTNQVLSVAFSPKGDLLASGGSDNSLKIWDIATSSPTTQFRHDAPIQRLSLSPDGKTVMASAANGRIQSWTLADGKAGTALAGGTWLGFGPSPAAVSTIGPDRILKTWALPAGTMTNQIGTSMSEMTGFAVHPSNGSHYLMTASGELLNYPAQLAAPKPLPALPVSVIGMSLSSDGQLALVWSPDKSARIVNISNGQVMQTLANLPADVRGISMLAGNQGYILGTADGQVHLFGTDGKLKFSQKSGEASLLTLLAHPSQAQVLTAGPGGGVKLWAIPKEAPKAGTPDPKPVASLSTNGPVSWMAFRPNGQLLTITNKLVQLWDVGTQKVLKAMPDLASATNAATLSKDGNLLAVGIGAKVVSIKLDSAELKELYDAGQPVTGLSFSSDATKLAVAVSDKTIRVLDLPSGQVQQFVSSPSRPVGLAFLANQPTLFIASDDKSLSLHPLQTVKLARDATLGKRLSINSTGSHLLTAGAGRGLGIWNTSNLTKERTLDLEAPIRAVAQSKNGQLLAVANGPGTTITLLNFADGALVGTIKADSPITELAFSPTTATLFAILEKNIVQSWSIPFDAGQPLPPEFGKPLQTFPHSAPISALGVTPDGLNLLTGSADQLVRVWKIISDQPTKNVPHPNLVDSVAFDPTGSQVATGCHDGIVRVIDVAKGAVTKTINAHTTPQAQPIYCVMWSLDGKQLFSASFDKSIKVWDVEKASLIREIKPGFDRFPPDPTVAQYTPAIIGALGSSWLNAPPDSGHRDQVFSLALSPDGKLLASASSDRTIKLWNWQSGELIRDFPNPTFKAPPPGLQAQSHPGFVHQVKFNRSGTKLISVGTAPRGQGYLAIWNAADGKLLGGYDLPIGPIYSLDVTDLGVFLGCGAKQRFQSESEAVLIPLPVK